MTTTIRFLVPLLTLAAMPANADVTRRHGSVCSAKHGSQTIVGADERGIYNASSSTTAQVTCPALDRVEHRSEVDYSDGHVGTFMDSPTITSIRVDGRDLSATVPFSCYLYYTEDTGFSSWGPTKYTCSQSGGCPDATAEFTGAASLAWSLSGLPIDASDHVGVVCNMPATTALGSSYVKSVRTVDKTVATLDLYSDKGFYIQWSE